MITVTRQTTYNCSKQEIDSMAEELKEVNDILLFGNRAGLHFGVNS